MNPNGTITANAYTNLCSDLENLLLNPTDCIEELKPCHKCKTIIQKIHSIYLYEPGFQIYEPSH